jgi:hypothetical protein
MGGTNSVDGGGMNARRGYYEVLGVEPVMAKRVMSGMRGWLEVDRKGKGNTAKVPSTTRWLKE